MAKNVRIQLASNFQVIELTYDSWDEVTEAEINQATDLVNQLGKTVINDIKTAPKTSEVKKEEMITDKQKQLLVGKFKFRPIDVENLTKKEAWNLINEVKEQK